jgi:hypothetical protein
MTNRQPVPADACIESLWIAGAEILAGTCVLHQGPRPMIMWAKCENSRCVNLIGGADQVDLDQRMARHRDECRWTTHAV